MDVKDAIELAKSSSEKGYSALYKKYYNIVHNTAYNIVRNKDLADDLTSEVFLKAFKKIDKYSKDISFEMWLKTITNNHCIDFIRSSVKLKNNIYIDDDQLPDFDITDFSNPEKEYIKKEHSIILNDIIKSMTGNMGISIRLFVYKQYSYQEIADFLGVSIGTVKSYIHKAKQKIANQQKKIKTNEKKSILLSGNQIIS